MAPGFSDGSKGACFSQGGRRSKTCTLDIVHVNKTHGWQGQEGKAGEIILDMMLRVGQRLHSLFGGTSRACPGLCEFLALFPLFIDYSRRRKCLHRRVTSRVMTEQPSRVARFVGRNPWSSRPCFAVRGACFEAMPGTVRKAVHMDRNQRPSLSFHCLRRCWSMCAGGAIRHRPRCANAPYVFQCIIAPRTVRWRPGARGSTWACAKPLHKNTVPSRHRRRRRRRRRRHRQAGVHTAGRRA